MRKINKYIQEIQNHETVTPPNRQFLFYHYFLRFIEQTQVEGKQQRKLQIHA